MAKSNFNSKTGKYETPKHDHLVFVIRYVERNAVDAIRAGDGYDLASLATMAAWRVADRLASCADNMLKQSHRSYWAHYAAEALQYQIMRNFSELAIFDETFDEEAIETNRMYADAIETAAELAMIVVANEMMRVLVREVETSSNPMTLLNSRAKHEVTADMMEKICGLSTWQMRDMATDMMHALWAKRDAEAEERRQMVVQIIIEKNRSSGTYFAKALNNDGDMLDSKVLPTARKEQAKEQGKSWAAEIRDSGRSFGKRDIDVIFN
jgi:hypothetical protein